MKKQKINRWILKLLVYLSSVLFMFPVSVRAESHGRNFDFDMRGNAKAYSLPDEDIIKLRSKTHGKTPITTNGSQKKKGSKTQFVLDEIIIKLKSEPHGRISITINGNKNVVTGLASPVQ